MELVLGHLASVLPAGTSVINRGVQIMKPDALPPLRAIVVQLPLESGLFQASALPRHPSISVPFAAAIASAPDVGGTHESTLTLYFEPVDADLPHVLVTGSVSVAGAARLAHSITHVLAAMEAAGCIPLALPREHMYITSQGHLTLHALQHAVPCVRTAERLWSGVHALARGVPQGDLATDVAPELRRALPSTPSTLLAVDVTGQTAFLCGRVLSYVLATCDSSGSLTPKHPGEESMLQSIRGVASALCAETVSARMSMTAALAVLARACASAVMPSPPLPHGWRLLPMHVQCGEADAATAWPVVVPAWPCDTVATLMSRACSIAHRRSASPAAALNPDALSTCLVVSTPTHSHWARGIIARELHAADVAPLLWRPASFTSMDRAGSSTPSPRGGAALLNALPRVISHASLRAELAASGITADSVVLIRSASEAGTVVDEMQARQTVLDERAVYGTPSSTAPSMASTHTQSAAPSPPLVTSSYMPSMTGGLAMHTPPRFTPPPGGSAGTAATSTRRHSSLLDTPLSTSMPPQVTETPPARPIAGVAAGAQARAATTPGTSVAKAVYVTPLRSTTAAALPSLSGATSDDFRFVADAASKMRAFGVRCTTADDGRLDVDIPSPMVLAPTDAMPAAYAAVARAPPKFSLLRDVLREVQNRSHTREEARLAVLSALGLPQLILASLFITSYVAKDEMSAALALQSLSNLAMVGDTRTRLADMGAIEGTVVAMDAHATSSRVQKDGIVALRHLAYENDTNKQRIVDRGGVHAVVRAMGRTDDTTQVQRQACGAIAIFAVHSTLGDAAKRSILDAGGVDAIVRVLRSHRGDPQLVIAALKALSMLVGLPEAKTAAKEAGALELMDALASDDSVAGSREVQDSLRFAARKIRG